MDSLSLAFQYWYMLPASVAIATIAMASGIGGAIFFSPLFMLVVKLPPAAAIGAALTTELFGFSSGVYAYGRLGLIDFKLGTMLLLCAMPAAIIGSVSSEHVPGNLLKGIFAVGVIFIGSQLYGAYRRDRAEPEPDPASPDPAVEHGSRLIDNAGNEYRYTVCNRGLGMAFAAIGGAFLGMISVGLAELQEYHLVVRCRVPTPVAVGTSIFVVVVSVLVASIGHFYSFIAAADRALLDQVLRVVAFTIPGVIIGGQIGPFVQARVNPHRVKLGIAMLFVVVGLVMLATLA